MPIRMRIKPWLCSAALCLLPISVMALDGPPQTPAGTAIDDYFGTQIVDPYRWLEDTDSDAFRVWSHAQTDYADALLARIPGRDKLKARLNELANATGSISDAKLAAGRLFYLKREAGSGARHLYVRDAEGNERMLSDFETAVGQEPRLSLDFFSPSPDGKLIVAGFSSTGSETRALRVLDVENNTWLNDTIADAGLATGGIGWRPDNRSFFYNSFRSSDKKGKSVVREHEIGQPTGKDKAVFGYGVSIKRHFAAIDVPYVMTSPSSGYAVAVVRHGASVDRSLYAAPMSSIKGPDAPWRKIAGPEDQIVDAVLRGNTLYVTSHKDAPRFRLLALDLAQPGHEKLMITPSRFVLGRMAAASDALYLRWLDNGVSRLLRVPYDEKPVAAVALPFDGSISELTADPLASGALLKLESWTEAPRYLRAEADSAETHDIGLTKPSSAGFASIETLNASVKSADGAMVPLTILHKKGIKLDGSNPAILHGYGAYGISLDPDFSPLRLAWLERGGVYAIAHVRGGGEFGEEWHQGAHILNKSNAIVDFIACAEYLEHEGYTSPKRLAAEGNGAGSIVISGAVMQHPELFGAAHIAEGITDMLRMEFAPDGPAGIPEFGTATKKDQFAAMASVSPYHQVGDGAGYPAMLLTSDDRANAWQSAKLAARLQTVAGSGKPVILRIGDAKHIPPRTREIAETADAWSFFLWQAGAQGFQPKP